MDEKIKLELTKEQLELLMRALQQLMTDDSGSLRDRQERYRECRGLHDILEESLDEASED